MNEDVFPIQDGDFPASYVCLPEGIFTSQQVDFNWLCKEGCMEISMLYLRT